MLWDTAGQEEFDAITKAYYRGSSLHHTVCECTVHEPRITTKILQVLRHASLLSQPQTERLSKLFGLGNER